MGNKVYENNALKRILVDGGYIEGGKYYFYQTDHLGNNRMVTSANAGVEQTTHYYPFGTSFADGLNSKLQPNKYNGKELDDMHGLGMYDYLARQLDAGIGRFSSVDPHAENYYGWSPYAYVGNNPMRFVDPDGKDVWDFLGGIKTGFVNRFENIGNAIANPIQTAKNAVNSQMNMSLGDRAIQTADMATFGAVSQTIDYTQAISADINGGDGSNTGKVLGGQLADGTIAVATTKAGQGVSKALSSPITNSVPKTLSRVIPAQIDGKTLGAPMAKDVFVTASKDIKGLNSSQIATKLTIPPNAEGFKVINFKTPVSGISSPVNRAADYPGMFVGKGRTLGGAREFTVPNQTIPINAKIKIVK